MSCPFQSPRSEPISDALVDKSLLLYPNHTIFTHLGCVALRSTLGVVLMNPRLCRKTQRSIMVLIGVAILVFGFKYFNQLHDNTTVWKTYPRMLIAYSVALYLVYTNQSQYAGLLIVVDALMGVQSRHMASALTCGIDK